MKHLETWCSIEAQAKQAVDSGWTVGGQWVDSGQLAGERSCVTFWRACMVIGKHKKALSDQPVKCATRSLPQCPTSSPY